MSFFDLISEGVSVPLTRLAGGYRPTGLIGEKIFPVVGSIMKSGKFPTFSKDAFKIYTTIRARGAKSNRAQISPDTWLTFACEEHDLAIPLDNRELEELRNIPTDARGKALFDLQNRQRRRAQWNMALEKEQVVANMVQDSANYTASNVVTLSGDDQWDSGVSASSTPHLDIETGREQIRKNIGVYPNTMVLGSEAYQCLKFHAAYTDKMKLTNDKVVQLDLLKSIHNLKNIYLGQSMMLSEADGTSFVDLWSDICLLYYAPDSTTPDLDEPSFGFTIVPKFSSKPFPYVDIFTEEGGKIVNVRNTDMYDHVFTMSHAGYLIKDVKK